jgi:ribosomal protein S18 acetylase RimI-like enzyme
MGFMFDTKIPGRDDIWLRQASASDFDLTFAIKKSAAGQYIADLFGWDEQVQIKFHKNQFCPENTILIVQDDTVVGWISVFDHDDHTKIDELYVLPEFQRKRIGTSVLHQVIEHVKMRKVPLRLRVFRINRGGIRLYERLGFAQQSADGPFLHMEFALPEKQAPEDG